MLGELQAPDTGRIVVADLEQGVGTISRLGPGQVDQLLLVVEPYAKSIETARRAAAIAAELGIPVVAVVNRVAADGDLDRVRQALGDLRLLTVPDDATVRDADREGVAPIDHDPHAPAIEAVASVADAVEGWMASRPGATLPLAP